MKSSCWIAPQEQLYRYLLLINFLLIYWLISLFITIYTIFKLRHGTVSSWGSRYKLLARMILYSGAFVACWVIGAVWRILQMFSFFNSSRTMVDSLFGLARIMTSVQCIIYAAIFLFDFSTAAILSRRNRFAGSMHRSVEEAAFENGRNEEVSLLLIPSSLSPQDDIEFFLRRDVVMALMIGIVESVCQ